MSDDLQALEIDFINQPSVDGALRLCEAYLGQKRFIEPAVVCRKALKMAPTDLRIRMMLARVYFEQGKAGRAQQELSGILDDSPQLAEALVLMGQACLALGQRVEAIRYLEQAAQSKPGLPAAVTLLRQLGVTLPDPQTQSAKAKGKSGTESGRLFIDATADDGEVYGGAAAGQFGLMGGYDDASSEADTSDDALAEEGHGGERAGAADRSARQLKDKKKPVRRANRLELPDLHPKRRFPPLVAVALGAIAVFVTCWVVFRARDEARHTEQVGQLSGAVVPLLHQDRAAGYRQALSIGEQIIAIDPNHAGTLAQMAYAAAVLGVEHGDQDALAQARGYLQRALDPSAEQQTADPWRLAASGLLAFHDQEYTAGYQVLQSAMEQGMNQPVVALEAFRLLAADHTKHGNDAVVNALDALSSMDDVRVQNFLGWYALEQDDIPQAKTYFSRAQKLQHTHEGATLGLLLTEIFNRDMSASVQASVRRSPLEHDLSRLLALPDTDLSPPLRAMAYLGRSHYWLLMDQPDNAEKDFLAAVSRDPDNGELYYRHGVRLLQLGSVDKGQSLLEEAVKHAPTRTDYRLRLVATELRTGDLAQAEENLRRATELGAADSDVTWLRAELWALQRRYDQAFSAYEAIKASDPHYVDAQIGIASLLRQQGESVRATAHLQGILEHLNPTTDAKQRANLLCALGDAHEQNNEAELAMASYRRGIQVYAFAPQCHLALCQVEDEAVARPSCKAYLNLEPHSAQAAQARQRVDQ